MARRYKARPDTFRTDLVNNLTHFFKSPKDPISKLDIADVVYNIPCPGCTANYIVTTKLPLKNRIREQIIDVFRPPEK